MAPALIGIRVSPPVLCTCPNVLRKNIWIACGASFHGLPEAVKSRKSSVAEVIKTEPPAGGTDRSDSLYLTQLRDRNP